MPVHFKRRLSFLATAGRRVPYWLLAVFVIGTCVVLLLSARQQFSWPQMALQLGQALGLGLIVSVIVNLFFTPWLRPSQADDMLRESGISDVFTFHDKDSLDRRNAREISILKAATSLDLLANSGANYLHNTGKMRAHLREALGRGIHLRLMLMNPSSIVARYRGGREQKLNYGDNDSNTHKDTTLAQDVESSLKAIRSLRDEFRHARIQVRLHDGAPHCSLLLTDQAAIVDMYHLGRNSDPALKTLGKSYPVIEYQNDGPGRRVHEILRDHFEWVWRNSPTPEEVELHRDEWNAAFDTPAHHGHKLISQHDSWLSVDPIVGCPSRCSYCVLHVKDLTKTAPIVYYPDTAVVAEMVTRHAYFSPNSVLAVGNSTDLMLPTNVEYAIELIKDLHAAAPDNTICITTKRVVTPEFLKKVEYCRDRLIFLLSYSGLPESAEPGIDKQNIVASLDNLNQKEFKAIHLWRPITMKNVSNETLEKVAERVAGRVQASVVIGMKYNPILCSREELFAQGLLPPELRGSGRYGEYFPENAFETIKKVAAKHELAIYRHTSCAVAKVVGRADYNGTWWRKEVCRASSCPDGQQKICETEARQPQEAAVLAELKIVMGRAIGDVHLTWKDGAVVLGNVVLNDEQYRRLLHGLSFPVECEVSHRDVWRGSIFPQ
jgi:hypothetical protein